MKYVGLVTQQQRNTRMTIVLLLFFPVIVLAIVALFFFIMSYVMKQNDMAYSPQDFIESYLRALPWVIGVVALWFLIAYKSNTAMVRAATGAHSLERRDNPRIYNIVENLSMTCGMNTPKINIINSPELNAFASGIDDKSYTVTLTTGIIDTLNDEELSGVVGHELTHIRNKDTRLLIVSIIFVGILGTMATLAYALLRGLLRANFWNNVSRRRGKNDNSAAIIGVMIVASLVALLCIGIGYFFTSLTRFAISRKREYLADAGAVELTGNSLALASALRKISGNPLLTKREDIAQMYIYFPFKKGFVSSMFSTHPPIEERIQILEQL